MFRALLSILVYVPSRDFSVDAVNAQLSQPYSKMDSTVATKNLFLRLWFMLDFQILLISLRALQASAFLAAMSFVDSSTHDPRYLKSFFRSSTDEDLVLSGGTGAVL